MRAAGSSQAPQRTPGSAYDVIPMRGLATLEHPLALVAGDPLVEQALFGTRVVEVMVDDVVSEGGSGHRPPLERVDRLPQRVGEALGVRLVGVAFEGGWQRERVLAVAPEARVDVAGVPDPGVVGLGHEGDRAAFEVRDLLRAVLVDDVVVGHRERVRVAEVDLLLAGPRLALRGLHADARALHPVPDLP